MQHFFPSAYLKYDVLKTSWTLTVEVIWYVLAFFLAMAGKRFYIPALILSIMVATWWIYVGKLLHPLWGTFESIWDYFFITNIFIAQLPFFLFGCVISRIKIRIPISLCLLVFVGIFGSYDLWINRVPNPIFITGVAIAALFYVAVTVDFGIKSKVVTFLSDTSYSVYLIHLPIIILVSKKVANPYVAGLISVVFILILSWLSYRFIEKPFNQMGRRWSCRLVGRCSGVDVTSTR